MEKLIVIAEKEELKLVERLGYKGYPIIITGVGALNVIDSLKDISRDTQIINIGYAGSKDLDVDRFYEVESVTLYHPNVDYAEPIYTLKYQGTWTEDDDDSEDTGKRCYTGTDFVLQSNERGCLFDMELAYIMALGFKNVKSYKYVSDNLDLQEHRNVIASMEQNG